MALRTAAAFGFAAFAAAAPPPQPATQYVWPLHGSSGAGGLGGWANSEVPVGANVPFGLMRVGPDTTWCYDGGDYWWLYNHYGGYFYQDTCIRAFGHTKMQGTGLGDLGLLGTMLSRNTSYAILPGPLNMSPYRSRFNHSNETAVAGYYSAWLEDATALAEVTVSGTLAGLHRYTCHAAGGAPCVLWMDACHRNHDDACGPGTLQLSPDPATPGGLLLAATLVDMGSFGHDCGGVAVHFAAALSATQGGAPLAFATVSAWVDGALAPGNASGVLANSSGASGSLGTIVAWPAPEAGAGGAPVVVTMRIGVSMTSQAAAAANLAAQQRDVNGSWVDFDAAAAGADAAWAAALASVVVNDVGYTAADVAAHRARLGADAAGAAAAAALHRVPGAAPVLPSGDDDAAFVSPARAPAAAAAAAWLAGLPAAARARWVAQHPGVDAADGFAVLDAAVAATGPTPPARTAALAGPAAAATGLGLPPHPVGLPPAERLGSFYSSLYHAFSGPTAYSDADGAYFGLDSAVHTVSWRGDAGVWYSDLSLWDVYRSQTPLLAVLAPTVAADLFSSMAADFNATGRTHVPHWVFASCETGCMPGSHGLAVLADFLVKGVPGATAAEVYYAATVALAEQDSSTYAALGYVPYGPGGADNGASLTLDFAFDDAVGAVLADLAGQPAQAAAWRNRSMSYKNIWSAGFGAMCPRFANGTFLSPCPPVDLPPILIDKFYTEGNGLQYTLGGVPHDPAGLVGLFASPAAFVSLMQQMMANTTMWPTNAFPNAWYWAGNEPDVLAPWLFAVVPTDAWRTQYWVRWVLDTYYGLVSDGVPGNDDVGELNAWAVWACLGLYPLAASPGGTYILSSPCFANVTLQVPAAASAAASSTAAPGAAHWSAAAAAPATAVLNIVAHNFTAANVYIVRAALNGVALPTPFVNHSTLLPPGQLAPSLLEFWLTSTPMVWGTGEPAAVPAW